MAIWHLDTVTAPLLPLSNASAATLCGPFCRPWNIHQCHLDYNEGILVCADEGLSRGRFNCLSIPGSVVLLPSYRSFNSSFLSDCQKNINKKRVLFPIANPFTSSAAPVLAQLVRDASCPCTFFPPSALDDPHPHPPPVHGHR